MTTTESLGRLVRYDIRSKSYPIKEIIDHSNLRSYTWRCRTVLDQGPDGACVGFAWAHELGARPYEMRNINYDRGMLYYQMAQLEDPWEGGSFMDKDSPNYYQGSSVLGGAQALYKAGVIRQYRWCFSLEDILLALSWNGPVVMGTLWYEQMFEPNEKGLLIPEGNITGGHAYLLNSIDLRNEEVGMVNSWGPYWGSKGTAKLKFKDIEKLLLNQGEACAPIDYYIR